MKKELRTDEFSRTAGDIRKGTYAKQLNLYKLAVEEFTDYKVKECIIYSIHLNDYIAVDC